MTCVTQSFDLHRQFLRVYFPMIHIHISSHFTAAFVFFSFIINHLLCFFFFFQAEDGIRDLIVTGVQTCALPISRTLRFIPSAVQQISNDDPKVDEMTTAAGVTAPDEELAGQPEAGPRRWAVLEIGRASCRERGRSRWSPYH